MDIKSIIANNPLIKNMVDKKEVGLDKSKRNKLYRV